jgi:hypothetical protein
MGNSNYLNVDIVSNQKTSEEELEKIISGIESSVKYPDVMEAFISNISLNFQNYVCILIEDLEFDNDYSDQLDDLLCAVENFIPGGSTVDSRVEWTPEMDDHNYIWFKTEEAWTFTESENENKNFGSADWSDDDYADSEGDVDSYW